MITESPPKSKQFYNDFTVGSLPKFVSFTIVVYDEGRSVFFEPPDCTNVYKVSRVLLGQLTVSLEM